MGLAQEKTFFRIFVQVRLKQACSATVTSWNLEILHVTNVVDMLSRELIIKVLIRQCFCSLYATKSDFLLTRPK